MKYTTAIDIDLPRSRVIELFDSFENMYKWMPGLISHEHLSGVSGHPGAKTKLLYKMGKREIEMIETITIRNLPDEFAGTYEAKGVSNVVSNRFEEISPNKTRWISDNEFKFGGFMAIIGWLMPGSFKKQSFKYLQLFKEFAEREVEKPK
ncbi:MAG: SRPBCC family protein [Bacteroidetes bacterium]|nr:SRPBCC family protein [Bacteroidota bacterium]